MKTQEARSGYQNIDEMLDGIEEHFWNKNVCRLKMDEIAAFLGIQRQSLYYHFQNKEAFLFSLMERSFQKRLSELRAVQKSGRLNEFVEWLVLYPSERKSAYSAAHAWDNYRGTPLEARIAEMQTRMRNEAIAYIEKRFHVPPARKFLIIQASRKIVESLYHGTDSFDRGEIVDEVRRLIDPSS